MKRIRITAHLDVTLTPEECGNFYDAGSARAFMHTQARSKARFLRDWGLEDDLDIDVEIVE